MSDESPQHGAEREGRGSPLDRPTASSSRALWVVAAVGVHALLLAGAALAPKGEHEGPARKAALVSELIEVKLEEPEPEPEAPEPEVEPEPPPPPVREARPTPKAVQPPPEPPAEPEPAPEPEAPAPEAAEAAEVLTAEPEAPVDVGGAVVSGSADAPVGGASAAAGTGKEPVQNPDAVVGGVKDGTGKAPAVDRSRPPGLAGGARWDCPFPREADFAGVDQAAVVLGVKVGQDGSVQSVSIHDDPGHGFGREARRCALRKRWQPGLDRAGAPIATTVHVRVRFHR